MYGNVKPGDKQFIPLLLREYVGHDGILGHLVCNQRYGSFPAWCITRPGEGETLADVEELVKGLIERDEGVLKEKDSDGLSPLHLICSIHSPGQLGVLKAICSAKSANVNVLEPTWRTPLHHALSPHNIQYHSKSPDGGRSLVDLIQFLVTSGANVKASDTNGVSPLHLALDLYNSGFTGNMKELPTVLEILIAAGAEVSKSVRTLSLSSSMSLEVKSSVKPMHLACRLKGSRSLNAIQLLLSPETVNCLDSLRRTPLHEVLLSTCKNPRKFPFVRDGLNVAPECDFILEKVSLLLENGADVNAKDVDEMTPLLMAIELFNFSNCIPLIKMLLSNGAHATLRSSDTKATPLHIACRYFDRNLPVLLPFFHNAHGRLNVPDRKLWTPFHYALKKYCCSVATLKVLVESGADVKMTDCGSNNSIHMVCSHRQYNFRGVVEFLVQKGCSVNDVNRYGDTPLLHLVQSNYDKEAVQTLIDLGADCKIANREGVTPLHLACRLLASSKENGEIVKIILRRGVDVNAVDSSNSTPLFYAVKDEAMVDFKVVHSLLLAGANPNIANHLGMAPLHVVCSYGHYSLAKLLLAFGADVNLVNGDLNTPLHEAAQATKGLPRDVCHTLFDAGADLGALNHKRCTPFLMMNLSTYTYLVGLIVILTFKRKYSLNRKERDLLNHNTSYSKRYADCFSCVGAMNHLHLGRSKITLMDFLLASSEKAHCIARNGDILEELSLICRNCTRYRPYSLMIEERLIECKDFLDLWDTALSSLNRITPKPLPVIVTDKILSNLNEFEMDALVQAVLEI